MKPKLAAPFFEVGVKNYIYGDDVLRLAKAADDAARKFAIDVLFIAPYTEIRRVAENTRNLIVLAPYMDLLAPGRGIADVLPEALKAAGARGVVVNHCEKPMALSAIKQTIDRAMSLDMLSFACSNTVAEAKAIAHFNPDVINPEPTELIGTGKPSDMKFVSQVTEAIKSINPSILVEQAAGLSTGKHAYDLIFAGAEACGACSGIVNAADPCAMVEEMISNVRKAYNDRKKTLLQETTT